MPGTRWKVICMDYLEPLPATEEKTKAWRAWPSIMQPPICKVRFWALAGLTPVQFSSVQSLSHVQLFATPWTAARQASLSIINSQSLPKPMPIESVMPSNHLISVVPFSSHFQSFPVSGSFQMSQLFALGGQSIGVSASTSVLPMNTQVWSPLGWTDWISLKSKGLSRVFSNTTVQKHQFFAPEAELFTDITLSLKPPRTSWAFPSSHPISDLQSSAKTPLFHDVFFNHYKVMANSLFGSPQPFTVSTLVLAVTLCCLLLWDSGGQWKEVLLNHTDSGCKPPWVLSGCMAVHSFTTKYSFTP